MKKNNSVLALGVLVKRNIKIFLKDKMMVFFSVLAPVIVLLVYILFLSKMQADSIQNMLQADFKGVELGEKEILAVINNWMISGVMAVSCITVAFNANTVMVRDRAYGRINDVLSSPVRRWVVYASYIISCFLITLGICFVVLMIGILYLACSGGIMMDFRDFMAIVGITILSTISAAFFTVLLVGFIKSEGALGAFSGVFTAAIGFLIGAYLPSAMMPKAIQYMTCFVPGTYSAGLFRNYFMNGPMRMLSSKVPADVVARLQKDYSLNLQFFGHEIPPTWMTFALVLSIVLFASLILIFYSSKRTNFFMFGKKHTKKSKKK